ncbi:MAG: CCA tRNA nucleotidyltransferase [Candidatus Limnocylindrales bacterium]
MPTSARRQRTQRQLAEGSPTVGARDPNDRRVGHPGADDVGKDSARDPGAPEVGTPPGAQPHPGAAAGPSPSEPATTSQIGAHVPSAVLRLLDHLWSAGHAAYVVGGSLRDALLGLPAYDWDVTTDARPEQLLSLFPGSHYENRFGTVLVPLGSGDVAEVTTFRRDHRYGDHRRPDAVTFSDNLEDDLARRDFTVNALAWGRPGATHRPAAARHTNVAARPGANGAPGIAQGPVPESAEALARPAGSAREPVLVDLFDGVRDLRDRVLRAVGDPHLRFDEDALRLVRAARLAAQLGFRIDPDTERAMREHAAQVRYVSQERLGQELRKLLRGREPSRGLRIMAETGILDAAIPELAEQRGLPQAKAPGMDCWEHTLQTVDAARSLRPDDELLALAALFHDVAKPRTMNGGHFIGHEQVGAEMASRILARLAIPGQETARVVHLIRHHMFNYESAWSDAAVRRLVQRVGRDAIDDLLVLREADNLGSGQRGDEGHLGELRQRIAEQQARGFPMALSELAVDGDDLQRELGIGPGPVIGALLNRLLEAAIGDPSRNTYRQEIQDARAWLPEMLARTTQRAGRRP